MCTTRGAVRRRARNALAALAFALPVIYFIDTGPAGPQSSISTRVEIFSPGRTGTRVEILSHGRADTLAAGSYGQAVNNSAPGSVAQPGWCGVVEVDDRRCPPETSVIDSPLSIATLPSGAPRWLSLDDVNAFNSTVSKLHARFAAAVPPGVAPNHESSEPLVDPLCGWFVADVVACGWGGCAPIEGGEDSLWAAVRRALPANRRAAIVAVKGRFVAQFFEQHWASIQRAGLPVVLVSSHGDVAHPAPALWPLLDDPLLLAWYAQNLWAVHPKARPLPIGFEPRWRTQGTPQRLAAGRSWAASHAPQKLLLVNFGLQTHPYRRYVDELSRARGWSQWATVTKVGAEIKPSVKGTGYASHDLAIADHKFVLAVRGNGIDTFRLWLVSAGLAWRMARRTLECDIDVAL